MILILGGAYQGKRAFAEKQFPGKTIMDRYHETVREQLRNGEDPLAAAESLAASGKDLVILMDEVGSGVVPMEKEERVWREMCGRCACIFAEQAEMVFRVASGIGVRIK